MALPTLTRAIGFRDDMLTTSQFTPLSIGSGITATSLTTDGDLLTMQGTWTSSNGILSTATEAVSGSLSTNTYPVVLVRHKDSGNFGTAMTAAVQVTYGDATNQSLNLSLGTSLTAQTFTLNAGKTISTIALLLTPPGGGSTGTFSATWDFVLMFKETLTLPTAIQPLAERKQRNLVEIPILMKEGGQVQDLGSLSPEVTIAGGLVSTTSGQSGWTNTYTADQWWQLLKGVTIECGTIQADGNPTWQWLTSDEINGKMLIRGASLQQVPGRIAYHNYVLAMKQFDINAETTSSLPGITY